MDLRELIIAYAEARVRLAADPDADERIACGRLLAEYDRRIALARNDHPIMWQSHLDERLASISRQRALLREADKDRASGWPPPAAAAHVRADLAAEHHTAKKGT